MRITILTPSYNQAQFIEENIQSVLNQSFPDVEHIVIDGGSTDGTVDILKKYPSILWVSEKDEGQADALQKGLEMSTGDIIGWINSDDYLEADILQFVADFFESSDADWIVGNLSFVYDNKEIVGAKSPKISKKSLLSNPDILRQQGTFFKKQFLMNAGGIDKKYDLTMDLDLWFRLLKISEPIMVDKNLAYFRIHENQKTTGECIVNQLQEILEIFSKNDATFFHRFKIRFRKSKIRLQIKLSNLRKGK